MQTCGHMDVDGCKQKRKKKHLLGVSSVRMGVRKRITVKKRKKRKEKRKTYWSGRVDVLRIGVRALAGGRGWL